MKQRVCCLYRVSTTKQVDRDKDNQADIPMQRKACRAFAEKMDWEIVQEEQENGVSGYKVSAADRDKIQTIKADAQQGKFDILLVFMFDRLGRKADETPFVVEWFAKHNIQVWSVKEGEQRFESHTDHLTNYIRFWQADGESQKTSMRTKEALSQMVQEGRFRGGTPPFGYRLEKSGIFNKRKHEVNKLVIDEEEAKIVRLMYSLCANSGYGRFRICTYLNEQHMYTRKGQYWHEASVGTILHNIMYMGILRSGETQSEIFPELQIIEPSTFELVQRLIKERTNEYNATRTMPRKTNGASLLSGNVFCGHCGARLNATTSRKTVVNQSNVVTKQTRRRYVCYNKRQKRAICDGQTGYTMHLLDDIVIALIHQVFDKMSALSEEEVLERTQNIAISSLEERLTQARKECTACEKEYDAMKSEVVKAVQGNSNFALDILSELVETAQKKALAANEHLCEIQKEIEKSAQKAETVKTDYQNLLQWSKIFDTSEQEVRKMIAGYMIKRIEVRKGYRIHVTFNFSVTQFDLGLEKELEFSEVLDV